MGGEVIEKKEKKKNRKTDYVNALDGPKRKTPL